jgi:predicted glycoside hydrolase/deacetylase ChbG (UPF0249 family)
VTGLTLKSEPRRIWLCADDYGIAPSVNVAIRDLIVRSRLNAVSVMIAAPSCFGAEANLLNALNTGTARVAIGLHLTLTAPFRPLSKTAHSRDSGGFLPLRSLLNRAFLYRLSRDALRAEIAAQLAAFVASFGRPPDFIDGHQHVHLLPQVSGALLETVKELAPNAWLRQCGRTLPIKNRFADRKGLFLDLLSHRFRRRAAAFGLRTNPGFAGTYDFDRRLDYAVVFPRFLEGLPNGGVVMCHPGFVDEELRRLDPLTSQRELEYAFFVGAAFPALLATHGVALA